MSYGIKAIAESGANRYAAMQDSQKRAVAVAAALEVIHALATNPGPATPDLEKEFDKLSKYADQIQQAISNR
jgi:hypothetical protein